VEEYFESPVDESKNFHLVLKSIEKRFSNLGQIFSKEFSIQSTVPLTFSSEAALYLKS